MKSQNYFKKIAIAAIGLFAFNVQANNLKITGTSVNTSAGTVTFNIQWENSWRTNIAPANNDAVWVFVKYQDCADKLWKHTNLSTSSADHTSGSLLKIDAVTDGKGVFVSRNANGGGNIPSTSVTIKMNVAAANYENYNFKVFGVEMVNIPQGDFWIGDGASTSAFTQVKVTSEASLAASSIGTGNTAPAAFPKGFKSFYSMKYEISQEQYIEFLNTLTYNQQARRSISTPDAPAGTYAFNNSYRNGIKIKTPGFNASTPAVYGADLVTGDFDDLNDGQNIAMNWLNFADVASYLDWSALRPMTELEFEKICRGPLDPVANEYAWGTTELNSILGTGVQNSGMENEGYNVVANGRANYGVTNGFAQPVNYTNPVKVGFTATGASGRASASAAYYGAMEMSGNVTEMAIVAKAAGSTFTGVLGDGELSTLAAIEGDANQLNWPDYTGVITRGGTFAVPGVSNFNNSATLKISDRSQPAPTATRYQGYGGRGVR